MEDNGVGEYDIEADEDGNIRAAAPEEHDPDVIQEETPRRPRGRPRRRPLQIQKPEPVRASAPPVADIDESVMPPARKSVGIAAPPAFDPSVGAPNVDVNPKEAWPRELEPLWERIIAHYNNKGGDPGTVQIQVWRLRNGSLNTQAIAIEPKLVGAQVLGNENMSAGEALKQCIIDCYHDGARGMALYEVIFYAASGDKLRKSAQFTLESTVEMAQRKKKLAEWSAQQSGQVPQQLGYGAPQYPQHPMYPQFQQYPPQWQQPQPQYAPAQPLPRVPVAMPAPPADISPAMREYLEGFRREFARNQGQVEEERRRRQMMEVGLGQPQHDDNDRLERMVQATSRATIAALVEAGVIGPKAAAVGVGAPAPVPFAPVAPPPPAVDQTQAMISTLGKVFDLFENMDRLKTRGLKVMGAQQVSAQPDEGVAEVVKEEPVVQEVQRFPLGNLIGEDLQWVPRGDEESLMEYIIKIGSMNPAKVGMIIQKAASVVPMGDLISGFMAKGGDMAAAASSVQAMANGFSAPTT